MSDPDNDTSVDAVADLIELLDQEGRRYDEIAAAVLEHINRPTDVVSVDSTDRYRVAVTRAAVAAAALGALGLITGFWVAVAAVWATTLREQLADTAMLSAFGGIVLLAGATVVIASSDAS